MNKEILNEQLVSMETQNPEVHLLAPGDLTSDETATNLVGLLQAMYVEHGITKNKEKLVSDIAKGNVLTWFAKKEGKFVATASLIKQQDGAWELGRAVSLDRGNGIGKRVILEALKFHIENHAGEALTAEVRAASEFEGIPSGIATQKIFFGLIDKILPLTPFAIAPLFAHGDPLRNEQFILSASDVKPGKTVTQRIKEVTNNRSTKGIIPHVRIVQEEPFQLVVPDEEGIRAIDVFEKTDNFDGCTLFPIETTDKNMPLIGMLSANENMVVCGVDRVNGKEGKPVIFIAEIGFNTHFTKDGRFADKTLLAPSTFSESLPPDIRRDLEKIAEKFMQKNLTQREDFRSGEEAWWEEEFRSMHEEEKKAREWEEKRRKEEIWEG